MAMVRGSTSTVTVTGHVSPDTTSNVISAANITKWTLVGVRKMTNLTPKAQAYTEYVPGAVKWWVDLEGLGDTAKKTEWYNRELITVELVYVTGDSQKIVMVGYFVSLDTLTDVDGVVRWKGRFESTKEFNIDPV